MTGRLAHIFRHPLKAIGREEIDRVTLTAGDWLPFDRLWAVAHEKSKIEGDGWAKKVNFLRGVTDPALMAITCRLNETDLGLTLSHPDAGEISFHPDRDAAPFLDWIGSIWNPELPRPTQVYRARGAHLTDVPDAWVSLNSLASLKALSQRAGQTLSPHRWRGNLWVDGLAPWQEFDWIGRRIAVGGAVLEVKQPITRCKATMANPETGRRDADTLALLDELGHQEFGVYAEVVEGGEIARDDRVAAA